VNVNEAIGTSVDETYERNGQAEQGSSATVVHLAGREALARHWQVSGRIYSGSCRELAALASPE